MKIFLDVDGVFADFDNKLDEVMKAAGKKFTRHSNEIWPELEKIPHLFDTLELLPDSLMLIEVLEKAGHDLEFLTALPIPTGNLATAKFDKGNWLRRMVSKTIPVNTVIGGANKGWWAMDYPGSILIDDYPRNIKVWEKCSGIGILHMSVGSTIAKLQQMDLI